MPFPGALRMAAILDGGFKIVESPHLTKSEIIPRTWADRLFSWPWRPWQSTRVRIVPDTAFYVQGNMIYCHPLMADGLRREMRDRIAGQPPNPYGDDY